MTNLTSVRSLDLASTDGLRSLYWLYDMTEPHGTVVWCTIVHSQWEKVLKVNVNALQHWLLYSDPAWSLSLSLVVLISESESIVHLCYVPLSSSKASPPCFCTSPWSVFTPTCSMLRLDTFVSKLLHQTQTFMDNTGPLLYGMLDRCHAQQGIRECNTEQSTKLPCMSMIDLLGIECLLMIPARRIIMW